MQNRKLIFAIATLAIIVFGIFFKKDISAQEITPSAPSLMEEFRRVLPEIGQGRKVLSILHGEKAILSEIRNVRFGSDYFVVQDSVWDGRRINVRSMFVRSTEVIWLIEDERSVVIKLRN
ncbi:MAG TPA: hypothetical protein VEC36_04400 [Patescibacteria group bacterium]|nr:hypothetical protein [Patescibacteria group bacterium]